MITYTNGGYCSYYPSNSFRNTRTAQYSVPILPNIQFRAKIFDGLYELVVFIDR